MSVFGWDDFGRDRKGKGERGEKKLFWVVWLEGKREKGGDFGGAHAFSPRTHQKNQSPIRRELWRDNWSGKRVYRK